MRRHGNFFDRLVSFENLLVAAKKAFHGKKDCQAVASFYFGLENEIIDLRSELMTGSDAPRKFRIFEVRDPTVRKICGSDFRDRVVHHAIFNLLEPIFERCLIHGTYACRTGRGCHVAPVTEGVPLWCQYPVSLRHVPRLRRSSLIRDASIPKRHL